MLTDFLFGMVLKNVSGNDLLDLIFPEAETMIPSFVSFKDSYYTVGVFCPLQLNYERHTDVLTSILDVFSIERRIDAVPPVLLVEHHG